MKLQPEIQPQIIKEILAYENMKPVCRDYKKLSYAYPTSEKAKQHNLSLYGCYFVESWNHEDLENGIERFHEEKAFKTIQEAIAYFDSINAETHRNSLKLWQIAQKIENISVNNAKKIYL